MKLGVRAKLFLVSCALIVLVVACAGLVAEREIRSFLVARIEAELLKDARAVATVVARAERGALDARVHELGAALAARITVIDDSGAVLADSELRESALTTVENHASRPEILAARANGRGAAVRFSTTLRTDMMYVAVPFDGAGLAGVVRAATPLLDVDKAVARLRALLLGAGAVAAVLAVFMSALASELSSRAVRDLVARTRRRSAVPADGDEIHALAGTFDQLSRELDRTVLALSEERDRSRAVLEGMQEAVVAVDESGRLSLVNRAARVLLARDVDVLGRPLVDVVRAPALLEAVARAAAGEATKTDVILDGVSFAVRATPTGGGAVVLVLDDVTDVVRLERVRRDFVANVSHELRTPVAVIVANTEILRDGGVDASRAAALLEATARHAERLSRLIADLLDLSRIESGATTLSKSAVSLADASERAVDAVRARAEAKGHRIEVTVDRALVASADPKALDQVLVNLLDNAVKYTPANGRIRVVASSLPDGAELAVEDDGPGVSPEHRARLFERFYRVDAGRSRDMGGTGLGLAIVKHLVEAMGGTVRVEPLVPNGSRFVVRLPRS